MKVKNNIRKIMILLVFTVIVSGVSVYATYKYLADDVSYTKSDGTDISVEDALNDLYAKTRPTEVVSSAHFVNSGTTITVDVGSIIVLVSAGSMSATNTETLCNLTYGDIINRYWLIFYGL